MQISIIIIYSPQPHLHLRPQPQPPALPRHRPHAQRPLDATPHDLAARRRHLVVIANLPLPLLPRIGRLLELPDLPRPHEPQTPRRAHEHHAREDLRVQIHPLRALPAQLQPDHLGERARHDQRDPEQTQRRRQHPQPHDLGRDGRDRRPQRARDAAAQQREQDQHAVALRGDPDGEAEHAARRRAQEAHVDAAERVAEVPDERAPDGLPQVQHRADDAGLLRREPDAHGVVGQREEQVDVADHAEAAPGEGQQELWAAQQARVEGVVDGADGGVAVLEEERRDGAGDAGDDAEDAEGPGQTEVPDHGAGGQGVDEAADAGAGGADAVREGAAAGEPLWDDADGAVEDEAEAEAEADALGEEELPDGRGPGGAEQRGGLEDDAQPDGRADAPALDHVGGGGGDGLGHGDREAADEGVLEGRGAGVGVVGEVVGEEDAVGLGGRLADKYRGRKEGRDARS